MINQVILSIGRKLSAHLYTTCIFCILLIVILIGGVIQVISSLTYLDSNSHSSLSTSTSPYTLSSSSISRININDYRDSSHETALPINAIQSQQQQSQQQQQQTPSQISLEYGKSNDYRTSMAALKSDRNDKLSNGRSFLNTKILYKQYAVNSNKNNDDDGGSLYKKQTNSSAPATKTKTINSTIFKSVTPSITDRVIADLKNEEYLAAQQKVRDGDEIVDNDDTIYIDGDEEEVNTVDSILGNGDHESSVEKVPQTSTASQESSDKENALNNQRSSTLIKKKSQQLTIGARDKKSSNVPKTISSIQYKKYKALGYTRIFPDIVDSGESDMNDDNDNSDDEDDDDLYGINSGSGDYTNNHLIDQPSIREWSSSATNRDVAQFKNKFNKSIKTIKSYDDDNTYDNNGSSDEMDNDSTSGDDFNDNDDTDDTPQQQLISKKIARVHKKQNLLQASAKNQNQNNYGALKSSTNGNNGNNNNKRKSKEQRYIDEYFNGPKDANTAEISEKEDDDNDSSKNKYNINRSISPGWMEPRIRRILGNIKKSEERSQQILLCKGEGELCSILFKTPIKPISIQ